MILKTILTIDVPIMIQNTRMIYNGDNQPHRRVEWLSPSGNMRKEAIYACYRKGMIGVGPTIKEAITNCLNALQA